MKHNGGRRPDEILAEIDRTRGEMDRTLSAIEHRLTPGQLVDQGISYFRESGANEFVQNLGGAAKQNPLPVALASIGIAWLMALGRQPAQHQGSMAYGSASPGPGMREKASGIAQGVSERMSSAKQQLGEKMGSMREGASGTMETAREQWQRARGGVDYLVQEQPLVLGAIGLAIGALLGGVAPRTQKEQELLGEASRSVTEKAKDLGSQQLEKAQEATKQAVAHATRKEPQSSGTTAAPPATPTGPRPPRQGT
jgi:ElaB/YqjD/DUF883 family membrane-anchored ribosome-binding protein